jgi:pimeloyl-ACP methyl ester carboxylesterase
MTSLDTGPAPATVLDLHGIPLTVRQFGEGPPLLFLHGLDGPTPGAAFLSLLASHFRLIVPTHPGFSGTPVPDAIDRIDDLAYLYLELLDALRLDGVMLAGASLGGWIAAELAVKCNHRLAGLVLVDSVGIKPGDRETRDIPDMFAMSLATFAELTHHDQSRLPDFSAMSDEALGEISQNREAAALYLWEPYMHDPKLLGRLHRVGVPALLLRGESDRFVSATYTDAFRAAIPNAQLITIPQAGHSPHLEQPAAFAGHVLSFAAHVLNR